MGARESDLMEKFPLLCFEILNEMLRASLNSFNDGYKTIEILQTHTAHSLECVWLFITPRYKILTFIYALCTSYLTITTLPPRYT